MHAREEDSQAPSSPSIALRGGDSFGRAVQLHLYFRLDEAENLYRKILAAVP